VRISGTSSTPTARRSSGWATRGGKGLCQRLTWEGFQQLTADRKAKGFTVVQIVCGPYPDEDSF